MAQSAKTDASQPPARSADDPGLATGSRRRIRLRRVVHRRYRISVWGTVPSDIRTRVSSAHASAIRGRLSTDREAKSP